MCSSKFQWFNICICDRRCCCWCLGSVQHFAHSAYCACFKPTGRASQGLWSCHPFPLSAFYSQTVTSRDGLHNSTALWWFLHSSVAAVSELWIKCWERKRMTPSRVLICMTCWFEACTTQYAGCTKCCTDPNSRRHEFGHRVVYQLAAVWWLSGS